MNRSRAAAEPPLQVIRAAQLLWLLVALIVVRTVLTVVVFDAYAGNVALAFVTVVLLGGLLSLCAVGVARGQRWARIVAVMFASVSALGGISSALNPSSAVYGVLGAIGALVSIAAIRFLWTGAANTYFRRPARRPA